MILYLHFSDPRTTNTPPDATYRQLIALLGDFTPLVQALPPDAALADISGSLRYFDRDPTGIAALIRTRTATLDTGTTIGIAPNPLLAHLTAHRATPGTTRTLPDNPHAITAFLTTLPATALPGVGPATARTLASYGLTTAGKIAATPLLTLQRILGTAPARQLHQRAAGIDPTPLTPGAPPPTVSAEHHFTRDELDPDRQRDALTHLAEHLGTQLRDEHRTCRSLTLTLHYADHSTTTRTRTLPEPTAHTPHLRTAAHAIHRGLALQRARVRHLALRADNLHDTDATPRQLTLDPTDDKARRIETATDRARTRYGPTAVRPASTAGIP
ncbi:DNA polymerase thumb domain-containing protein [Streptomyces sp. BBFR2]|uniref:DNA polymerase Y family protein n=1 Tax=Streptomyces sp. BBFR2 TaxID=3372854 RepID=UPI0037D9B6AF